MLQALRSKHNDHHLEQRLHGEIKEQSDDMEYEQTL
jgi:hypothetical protein